MTANRGEHPTAAASASSFCSELGAGVKARRFARQMTQVELAEQTNLSLKYVGELERGHGNPTLTTLERVCVELDWHPFAPPPEPTPDRAEQAVATIRRVLLELKPWMELLGEFMNAHTRPAARPSPQPSPLPPMPRTPRPSTRQRARKSTR